jgi:hypothetical protein
MLALAQAGQGRWQAAQATFKRPGSGPRAGPAYSPLERVALFKAKLGLMRGQLDSAAGRAPGKRVGH